VGILLTSTVNKIAHPIMDRMRRSHDSGDEGHIETWREMFNLGESIDNSDLIQMTSRVELLVCQRLCLPPDFKTKAE